MLRYIHLIIRPGCFLYRSSQLCHVRRLQLRPHPASFQILNNQKNARRWENDDDVTTCNGCERQFSMTIRKVCFSGLKEDQNSITSSILFAIFFCFLLIFFPSFSASLSELRVSINTLTFPLWFRLQNSPYFCVFKYTRAVKQTVWNEAENRERVWGSRASRA